MPKPNGSVSYSGCKTFAADSRGSTRIQSLSRPTPSGKACDNNRYNLRMKAYVYVSLKKTVLDPQGKTIQGALGRMGYRGVDDLRQGKYFEITLDGKMARPQAEAEVERMARDVLTNPVIEEYSYRIED